MTGSRTIYAVSSGSYSDYSVHCIFETREDAEAYAAGGSDWDIEEFQLYPAGAQPQVIGTIYVAWWDGGGIGELARPIWDLYPEEIPRRPKVVEYDTLGGHYIQATASSRNAAVKAVYDRRARYLATQANIA